MSNFKEQIDEYRTYDGRITRNTYIMRVIGRWVASFVVTLLLQLFVFLISAVLSGIPGTDTMYSLVFLIPIAFIVGLTFFFFKIFQEIRRLHDIDHSGWWAIIGFIPLLNIIYYLILILQDGTAGPNKYGEDPKNRVSQTPENEQ